MTASAVAAIVAERSADPARLDAAVAAAARQSKYADMLPWRPSSLSMGRAGIALLCAEMDRRSPGQGWAEAGHRHLDAAVRAVDNWDHSLFSGVAGVGFAAVLLAGGRPRYTRLLDTVDTALEPAVERAAHRLDGANGCGVREFDLISGLTGIGAYLLTRYQSGGPGTTLIRALSALTGLLADGGHPRRWHTPARLATGSLRDVYPDGHHNCGLAHGVAGPLALLSLAALEGVEAPGTRAAIGVTAEWLAAARTGTPREPDWPDAVSLDPDAPTHDDRMPGRAAWCYGAPGVARSLWLAGTALDRPEWCDLAATTIRAIARRPPETWWLATPSFCHGRAGLLQILHRFAADLDDPTVAAAAGTLAALVAAEYDTSAVLGVRSIEPEGVLVDHPGLLDGAPGVALALLGPPPADDGRPPVGWDRMFLLS